MSIKNVAVAGASGNIGKFIIDALEAAGQFNISILTRSGSNNKQTYGAHIKTPAVDYDDQTSLVEALRGQDAVVSGLNHLASAQQDALIEASAVAGVKRFIPSEFGSDTLNPLAEKLPVFAGKKKVQSRLVTLADEGKLTYSLVMTGPWLDYLLDLGFTGLDLKQKVLTTLDGGVKPFSVTTRPTVGTAVARILSHPEETKNRAVYVQEAVTTQNDLLRLAKNAVGAEGWSVVDDGTTMDKEKDSYAKLAAGQFDFSVMIGFLCSAMMRDGYGGVFEKPDNKLLGIEGIDEKKIETLIQEAVQQ